ncbi:DUF5995 family protein [Occallatibacter riparius]|uniref:DUF5995 family protein n=1 Tax=Occallatibacter riparius TaxID=1002689 RepID=A0A9J7BJ25_9BACT|nr:DUF5995 family protein [Occallatibacter riparius]UWZ82507.1 DUF5995 family protein [Occallatibacter riparius]
MATTTSSPADQALAGIVSGPEPNTIADVIALMQAIDAALGNDDGLKWFNKLYLMVTEQVDLNPPGGAWQSPRWLVALDVVFARYYFDAIRGYLAGTGTASSWSAVFEVRFKAGVDRIQFALAGMNAHINHDLAQALTDTDAALNVMPALNGPEHADYESVNGLLNNLMPATLEMLASDVLGVIAQDTGKVGQLLAFWNICKARDLAWDFAGHLRSLPAFARPFAMDAQDAVTGALGRAILTVV